MQPFLRVRGNAMIDEARASRLLAASWYAYYAGGEKAPSDLWPRVAQIGFLPKPKYVVSGTPYGLLGPFANLAPGVFIPFPKRDSAVIGVTASEIIVAFRGTLPPETKDRAALAADWLNNAQAELAERAPMNGLSHAGFAEALRYLWPKVGAVLSALLPLYPTLPVCFTGHSKGGALALMAPAYFKADGNTRRPLVCTFASPRAGDAAFAQGALALMNDCRRYEYGNDPVPHLPPNGPLPHFAPTGRLCYLRRLADGQSAEGLAVADVGLGDAAGAALAAQVLVDALQGRFDPGGDHRIDTESGYGRWIYARQP